MTIAADQLPAGEAHGVQSQVSSCACSALQGLGCAGGTCRLQSRSARLHSSMLSGSAACLGQVGPALRRGQHLRAGSCRQEAAAEVQLGRAQRLTPAGQARRAHPSEPLAPGRGRCPAQTAQCGARRWPAPRPGPCLPAWPGPGRPAAPGSAPVKDAQPSGRAPGCMVSSRELQRPHSQAPCGPALLHLVRLARNAASAHASAQLGADARQAAAAQHGRAGSAQDLQTPCARESSAGPLIGKERQAHIAAGHVHVAHPSRVQVGQACGNGDGHLLTPARAGLESTASMRATACAGR